MEHFRPTVYQTAHFYGVGELKRLLKSVGGEKARLLWHTTLLPRPWPSQPCQLPFGAFIAMALMLPEGRVA
jgi:hypothetical protein